MHIVLFYSIVLTGISHSQDSIFVVPDIIKDNVEFWMKIYTEIPTTQGVFHDRDYPQIIYRQVYASEARRARDRIESMLHRITSEPESAWTEEELAIAQKLRSTGDSTILSDAVERMRFQLGQQDHFREGLKRSGMYIDTMLSILRSYGVPDRLVYLPHVESSFNTAAYSKVGAAGLWQFMRGTGRIYGMAINYTIDERRDPVIATRAAAKYLSSSYNALGSWPVAITSYNYGFYGMKRAVAETGSNDLGVIIRNYKSRSFKFASTNFYGCFIAASEIAMNHKKYFSDVKVQPKVEYNDLTLDHFIRADVLCRYLDISKPVLTAFNPAIRPAVLDGRKQLPKGFTIHVPAQSFNQAQLAFSTIPDSLKQDEPERPKYYRVARGDNLWSIASRLGIPVGDLMAENNLGRKSRIRSGQVLRVPEKVTVVAMAPPPPTTPAKEQASLSQASAKSISSIPAPSVELPPLPVPDIARIGSQDSTAGIAEIASAEPLFSSGKDETGSVPSVKQSEVRKTPERKEVKETASTAQVSFVRSAQLQAKSATTPISAIAETAVKPKETQKPSSALADSLKEVAMAPAISDQTQPPTQRPSIPAGFDVTMYNLDAVLSSTGNTAGIRATVDETIGHYADWLGIATWRIRKLNDLGRNSDIRVNQRLEIPIDRPDALEQFTAARLEYHMAIEEDFYTQYKVVDTKEHVITRGETLWDICHDSESEIPLWLFKKYNKELDLSRLMPGTSVWIPVIGEKTDKDIAMQSTDRNGKVSQSVKPVKNSGQGLMLVP